MKNLPLLVCVLGLVALPIAKANTSTSKCSSTPAKKVITATKTASISIPSMHCAGCAIGVSTTLKKIAGVNSVQVEAKTRKATVVYKSAVVSPQTMLSSLEKAGWKAKLISASPSPAKPTSKSNSDDSESMAQCPDCP